MPWRNMAKNHGIKTAQSSCFVARSGIGQPPVIRYQTRDFA
jgi:hypothetical protein